MSRFRHYELLPDGEIEMRPGEAVADCIPYIIQQGDKDILCVMEGDAFHTFDISAGGLARLAEEATRRLRQIVSGRLK